MLDSSRLGKSGAERSDEMQFHETILNAGIGLVNLWFFGNSDFELDRCDEI
jgi:hypothetical protein